MEDGRSSWGASQSNFDAAAVGSVESSKAHNASTRLKGLYVCFRPNMKVLPRRCEIEDAHKIISLLIFCV